MFPSIFYKLGLLACESSAVVQLRLWRIFAGGPDALDESVLMVREKVDAAREASCSLATGGSLSSIVDRYRWRVAGNIDRLTAVRS